MWTRGRSASLVRVAARQKQRLQQQHGRRSTTTTTTSSPGGEGGERLVYQGGFDNVLRLLKRVSVFSCTCTVVGVPLLAIASEHPRMTPVQKYVVAFVVVVCGVTTTVALHVVAKPYVAKLYASAGGEALRLETLNFLGHTKQHTMRFADLAPCDKPWATFASRHDPKTIFFVEEAPDAYEDQDFRRRLFAKVGRKVA